VSEIHVFLCCFGLESLDTNSSRLCYLLAVIVFIPVLVTNSAESYSKVLIIIQVLFVIYYPSFVGEFRFYQKVETMIGLSKLVFLSIFTTTNSNSN
jgi:Ca2+/Na+ antiporter